MESRVSQFATLFLIACSLFQVSRCLSEDTESGVDADFDFSGSLVFQTPSTYKILKRVMGYNHTVETFDFQRKLLGVNTVEPSLVSTSCIFPNESGRSFVPGEKYMIWLTVKNNGLSRLLMIAIVGKIYHPHDHDNHVQQLTPKGYIHEYIEPSATRMFPYSFVVSNDLKVGKYDLVGNLLYVMLMDFDYTPHNTTFYNGTIKIVESRVIVLVRKSVIYVTLGVAFLILLWWGCTKLFQKWEEKKKAKIAQEKAVEEILFGKENDSVAQSSSNKNKKSKKK